MAERKRAWRPLQRLLRVVAFLVLAVLVLGVSAYLLRGPLFGRLLAERIERELAARLGGRFSVQRVEGSYVFDLALVGLRTEEAPPGLLRRLDCGRAVVEFDLRRMLDGDLGAITSVLASGAVVEIDLTRKGGGAGAAEPPRLLPRLELQGRVAVATEFGEVRAEGLLVNTSGTEALAVRATALRLPERFGPPAPFAGTIKRTGPLAFVLTSDTPVAGVVPARVACDGALDARLVVGGSAAELRVADGEARFTSAALDLARLPSWAFPQGIEPPREAVASVEARAASRLPLAVEITASAPLLRWRDLELRDARVEVRHAEGRTILRTAHAEGEGFLLDARDVVLDPDLPWLVGDVGEATVRVADLRTVEPRLDRPHSLSRRARRASGAGFAIDAARLEGEGILLEGSGEVVPPDDPARWREAAISGKCSGTVRDFARGRYAFAGELHLSGEATGTLAAPEASLVAEGRELLVEGRALDRFRLEAHVGKRLLRVLEMRVDAAAGTLRADGLVDLEARTVEEGSYEIDVADLEAFLRLFPGTPSAQGSLSGRGRFAADATGASGTAEIAAAGVVALGREIGNLSLKARAEGREVTIEQAEAKGAWGTARGKGVVRGGEANVEALEIDAGPVHAGLRRPFRIAWGRDGAVTGALDFSALCGRVQGTATVRDSGQLEAALFGDEIDLSLLDGRLAGRATGALRIDGDRYEIDVTAPAAAYDGRAGDVRMKVRSGLDGIVVERLLLTAGEKLTIEGTATLPWRFNGRVFERVETTKPSLALEVRARGLETRGVIVEGAVASVRGEGRDLKATARLRDVTVDGFRVRGETSVEASSTPGRIEATAVLERCDLGDAEARATSDRGFDWTRPEEVRAALDAATVQGEIRLRAPDLAAFRRLVPGLTELSGTADGVLALSGPLAAPSIGGDLHLAGIGLKAEGDVPRLTDGRADLRFDGRTVRVTAFSGELGYAPVAAEGAIDLGAPGGAVLDLRLTGTNTLVLNDPGLRIRADLDLTVTGAPDALKVGGRATIRDALYTRASKLLARGRRTVSDGMALFSIRRAPFASATLDLEVTADETIRIRAPDLRGDLSCDLRVRGTGEAPAPEGRIFVRDMLVELQPVAALKVDRGEIQFPPGEPFDPRLDVTAHTRLKGYEIEVDLLGRIDDAELRMSSRPSLPQDDVIVLLATGYTREELESEGIGQAAFEKLAAFLGRRLVSRLSGPRDPDERTFLERFQFRVGKNVSRSGDDTIEAEFEASKKLFLRVERDRFDEYNGGVVWRIRFR